MSRDDLGDPEPLDDRAEKLSPLLFLGLESGLIEIGAVPRLVGVCTGWMDGEFMLVMGEGSENRQD